MAPMSAVKMVYYCSQGGSKPGKIPEADSFLHELIKAIVMTAELTEVTKQIVK